MRQCVTAGSAAIHAPYFHHRRRAQIGIAQPANEQAARRQRLEESFNHDTAVSASPGGGKAAAGELPLA
jgi:hypothetical protein